MDRVWTVGRAIVYPLCRLIRWRIVGLGALPRDGAVLLASNHISFLDPLAILWLGDRRRRKVRFLAKAELWRVGFFRFFLTRTGQIPVDRRSIAAVGTLGAAAAALNDGECVCVYPEGTISDNLEPMAAKAGVARLAARTGVPVTPVGLWGTHRLSTKGRPAHLAVGVAVSIAVGAPIVIAPDEDAFAATDRIMAAVVECVATARRIYPQAPGRHDDGWWVRAAETAVLQPTRRGRHRR
jgi:1-acyl-sn-glycerol-3-phosphate acyltransferase